MTDAFGTVWYGGDEPPEAWVDAPDDADYQAAYEWTTVYWAVYDSKVGAVYVNLKPGGKVSKTIPANTAEVNLDYDENGKLIGIEVLL